MRISRQYRDLQIRKRAGVAYDGTIKERLGGLVIFCPSCPQPGVNLPSPEEYTETEK